MGSLSATGIPVVAKTNMSFRKRDIYITKESSTNDTIANVVVRPHVEVVGSGSVVRDNGSVVYLEEKVWSTYRMGRSTTERVASKAGNSREVIVDLGNGQTRAVVPTALTPNNPQLGEYHTGDRVVKVQAVTNTVVTRSADSGVFDIGFPL